MTAIGILWMQYGPYHLARASALQKLARPVRVHALELANQSRDYAWTRDEKSIELATLCPGMVTERLSFRTVFTSTRRYLKDSRISVCLLPSYSPLQPFAALLAAKSLGIKIVMMNESHAGTARAGRAGTWIKRRLISMFDAALVGGAPQKRYFESLGLPADRIFDGYDAVDNDYFAAKAENVRNHKSEVRNQYGLPDRYFLSLGRFVPKKNLSTLIRAYRRFLDANSAAQSHLVLVGSGEEDLRLRSLCAELKLPLYDHVQPPVPYPAIRNPEPGVHFYGFRQVEENPVFYALADAFILPSLYEEWGLVVNEAMASGLPVVVSETAGCAEDLLEADPPARSDATPADSGVVARKVRRNGFVFDPRSARELAGILQFLESHPDRRDAMGNASREIVEKFSCRRFAENALLAARTALENRTGATAGDPAIIGAGAVVTGDVPGREI